MPQTNRSKLKSTISVTLGRTINTGDYNSIRIEYGLSMDIPSINEEIIEKGYEQAFEIVGKKVEEFLQSLNKGDEDVG